jgi:hypothetical protein
MKKKTKTHNTIPSARPHVRSVMRVDSLLALLVRHQQAMFKNSVNYGVLKSQKPILLQVKMEMKKCCGPHVGLDLRNWA